MIKICARCGGEFVGHDNSLYCDKCREIVRREQLKRNDERQRERQRRLDTQKKFDEATGKTLDDWAREARDCNLDAVAYLKAERRS